MAAQIVLDHYLEKFQTIGNTLTDVAFDNLEFLSVQEPVIDLKGQRVSKSYFDVKGKEAIRITYEKIYGDHTYNEVTYNDVFLGMQKTINFMDWAGDIGITKKMQPYYFNLEPVFVGDGTETVTGFSSLKQRQILKQERGLADAFLQAKNPNLYALIYAAYSNQYEFYLKTGQKTSLADAITNVTDPDLNEVLDNIVFGTVDYTVRQLILDNLQ